MLKHNLISAVQIKEFADLSESENYKCKNHLATEANAGGELSQIIISPCFIMYESNLVLYFSLPAVIE